MSSKRYRLSKCANPAQILTRVKRQIEREKEYQKIQENLLYLNNSFSNNIQLQEIFIDICKGKKKNIRSKEIKTMYSIFSQNKANLCIFQKIAEQELQKLKNQKNMSESTFSKWAKQSRVLMQIVEQDQSQSQKNIKTITNLQSQIQSSINMVSEKDEKKQKKNKKLHGISSINTVESSSNNAQDTRQFQFLVRRIYCRIIEKMLVKIAFYNMNNRFLDFIALNILELTKNLQTIIRKLAIIKDVRLLQQIILKVFRENLILQNQIYQSLINGGYIVSIDEFYRVNGIDIVHKDVFERNSSQKQSRKKKQTLKQTMQKIRQSKQKQNVVKKVHIDRINNQINQKYLHCIAQMRQIVNEFQQKQQMESEVSEQKKQAKLSIFSKTQPLGQKNLPKPQRFSHLSQQISIFSPEFSKNIKAYSSQDKLNRNLVAVSENFLKFNEFEKIQRKQSITDPQRGQFQAQKEKSLKKNSKKKSSIFQTFAINKLLKLYEAKNTDRYSIDDLLGSESLPKQIRKSLKEEMLKLKFMYDPSSKRSSNQSGFQTYASQDKLNSQRLESAQNSMTPKYEQNGKDDFTGRIFNMNKNKKNGRFSSPNVLTRKKVSQKQQNCKNDSDNKDNAHNSAQKDQTDDKYKQNLIQAYEQLIVSNQHCLVKFQKNRHRHKKSTDFINSQNHSIFSVHGVRNLLVNVLNADIPLKNQKLKRITFTKIKDKLNQSITIQNNIISLKPAQMLQISKLSRKAYQSQHLSKEDFNLNRTIEQILAKNVNKKLEPIWSKDDKRVNFRHKAEVQHVNLGQRQERSVKLHNFAPQFVQKDDVIIQVDQTKSKPFWNKKLNSYHLDRRPQGINFSKSAQKQQRPLTFEIYDIHRRRKIDR